MTCDSTWKPERRWSRWGPRRWPSRGCRNGWRRSGLVAEVIVALDQDSAAAALALVERLPGLKWAKVGATLYVREGPAVVRALRDRGVEVFLDLKWHDIPNQVAG